MRYYLTKAYKTVGLLTLFIAAFGCSNGDASKNNDVGNAGEPTGGERGVDSTPNGGSGQATAINAARPIRTEEASFIDHTCVDLGEIPNEALSNAKATLHIAYNHTSHGSQLITGMDSLMNFPEFGSKYDWNGRGSGRALDLRDRGIQPSSKPDLSQGDEVDANGDTPWVVDTRSFLDDPANSDINVILWSWCSINGHDAQRYVDNMEKLIAEYPHVTFPFMTGHSEGQGEALSPNSVHYNNEFIRKHCGDNGRLLFDFADIEAYDPDGTYYWDRNMLDNLSYSDGNWGEEWCAVNKGSELERLTSGDGVDGYGGTIGCAHSDSPAEANLNCVLKGRAAWWMWARIAGWDGR